MIPGVGGVPRARLFALLLLTLVEVIARALGDPAPYVGRTAPQGGGALYSSKAAGIFFGNKQNDVTSVTTQLARAGGSSVGASSDLWIHPEDGEALPVGAPRIERSTAKRHSAAATDTGSKYNFHFAHAVYNVSIPENSVIKTYAVQPPNEDRMGIHVTPDLEVKYKIVSGDKDKFFKAEERAVGDFVFLAIRLRTNNIVLNREKGDSYRLEVKATGTRREGKSRISLEADTVIDVRVLDANDLSPLFYPTEYSVAITEDTPLHKSILHVVAEDADLGLNGEIYYSILDETEQFAVHPTTGVITLTRPLRFTDSALHELMVVANDRGIGSTRNQASKARVKIKVLQVNLFAPEFKIRALPDILENSNTNIFGIVLVTDKDKGVHGQIKSLDIVDGDPDGHFRIKPTNRPGEYVIEVHRLLDRETAPAGYNLTLRAVDRGIPPKQAYIVTPVRLADINDNAPVFNREIYEVSVPETSPPNTPVIRLKVTDRDEGKNAKVFLEIVGGNEGGEFRVNPETGMLYTAVPLDAEQKAFYTLTVSAIDQGNPGTRKQSSAKVKINVQDTNDNDPIFETSNLTIYVDENEPAGTIVTKVTARDKDLGENAYISYSIANLNDVPFDIDHFSGSVRTSKLLDYESMRREYVLRVRASDWGLPYRRQTEMQLVIKLRDVNDNRPQFERIDCLGRIPRYTPIGTEIFTLSALDFDYGSVVTYRLLSGFEDGCFNLDAVTGIISVGCDLNDVGVEQRELNVTATDGTHFADTARIQINLVRNKRNLGANLKAEDGATFECRETGVAQRLTEIMAAAERNNMPGRDAGNGGGGASDDFAMMPSRYGENVHAPEFVDLPLEVKINESMPLGTTITWIKARDRDLGYNGKLVFGISGGDDDSVFRLDPDNGELKIIGYLDRERQDEYLLNITVYDLGKPQKSISKILPITILDENDNVPRFEKSLASFRVTENALNGTVIFRVNATDADLGQNAKVTYSLVTDTKDFRVDAETGVLMVVAPLDRERQEVYELKIRATDGGGDQNTPALYSDALVRVTVDDINDNAPEFSVQDLTVRIREDVPRGTVVTVVSAIDLDSGPSSEILYSFGENGDGEGSFRIDKQSGTIRTAKMLDFEERQVHSLIVKAIDRGTPSLSSETAVIVEVIDVNENRFAPQFEDYVLVGSIAENKPPGAQVMHVVAKDADLPGPDSRVTYSIKGGDGLGIFTIDNEGTIRTLASLDLETKPSYWLTVCAQDQAVVPLHSCVQVFIEVLNENDNVPLTQDAVYYPSVPESSPAGVKVLQLVAEDRDIDLYQQISYRITSGNPEGYFAINSSSGLITTTARKLDRENQPEHILEVLVMDSGAPQLSSTTRVVVQVEDINDHAPEFDQKMYKVQIPANAKIDQPLFQNDYASSGFEPPELELPEPMLSDPDVGLDDAATWESFPEKNFNDLQVVFRVLATDQDIGENGRVTYSIKPGRGKAKKFRIDPDTGVIYAARTFEVDTEYDLLVRAEDHGVPKRSQQARVVVAVVGVPLESHNPPVVKTGDQHVELTESDVPGFLVTLIQASDHDGEQLWYDIVGGDDRNEFYIGRDNGNVLLAKYLDWERQREYNITISISDGVHTVYTQLYVSVIDINDHRPEFTESVYRVDISENIEEGMEVLQLHATDEDEDKKLFYSLHAARDPISLKLFRVDSVTGSIVMAHRLDRETLAEHVLIVIVKDQGTPAKRNYATVVITVHDHNDHAPEFTTKIVQGKVYETAAIGTRVVQVYAIDRDIGDNARITYTIVSGNIGNVFGIDSNMGVISVAKQLDISTLSEYMLQVKATDGGKPALSSQIPVHIMINMADNAPPRFTSEDPAAEIYENLPIGTFVIHLEARSTSSLLFQIVGGNVDDVFFINPSTGVITTKDLLDYEHNKFYNLTVRATNMASASATCSVIINVLDKNDNVPYFEQQVYRGEVSEAAPIGSLVLTLSEPMLTQANGNGALSGTTGNNNHMVNASLPLVIKAKDDDSGLNALLHYDILDMLPRRYFHIDSSTGAIKTIMFLDHEKIPFFSFHVKVTDLGKPRLTSELTAEVRINITDVNDCAPMFSQKEYNVTLLLPTYANVAVLQVNATDEDSSENSTLRYDIIEGNRDGVFAIDAQSGIITTRDVESIGPSYRLAVRVSDGKFAKVAQVYINVETSENSGLIFQRPIYEGSIMENSTKISTVAVVNVLGSNLNEHIEFNILNPTDMFRIGLTSGAIQTTGQKFDREVRDNYELIVEARSQQPDREKPRVAHVIVNVTILDINDNCPMFVNLPYYAVVSVDDPRGSVITKVHALDLDSFENGEVRYEMKRGHGELFKVDRKTGEVTLKQTLEGHNRDYELLISAYDGGITPCSTDVTVHVKVIDKSMPVFSKQFYSDTVAENIELHSPLSVAIQAESPLGRKLIYSIVKGNELEEFAVDFNTAPDSTNGPCAIYVVDELDYERLQSYELLIRATDSVSGVSAEVPVSVLVQDVNDCPPEIEQDSYNITVSERAPFGTAILKVQAKDNDTGINQVINYVLQTDSKNTSEHFHMDPVDGVIYLKKSLDHETLSHHHFTVVASDKGVPSLSSTAHVWVSVMDMNDNPPKFEQPSYSCVLSEHASRGQFVTVVSASDPDYIDHDRLVYTIAQGNELQTYGIDPVTGIITLVNMQNFAEKHVSILNVSATDGVYTSFTRVKITILPANLHNPTFELLNYEAKVDENQLAGRLVTTVKATDKDFGEYGRLAYSIISDDMQEYFSIDKEKGEIVTKKKLDREERMQYEVPVMAVDAGGRAGFSTVRIRIGDENDNQPVFQYREYKTLIQGNLTVNTTFYRVRAVDADDNQNAVVKYSIFDAANSGIRELFGVDENTGGLYLKKSAVQWENQLFQFFIRANDGGTPSLYSDVPIDIYVMSSAENPPLFEKKDRKLFLSESSLPGTVITRLRLSGNVTAHYRILSDELEEPQFTINDAGQLRLAKTLDRETRDSHLIAILAETDSSPPLTAVTEIVLHVQDENDNTPIFESNPYSFTLAENIEKGSSIMKLTARDADSGNNGDIRYALSPDVGDIVNIFDVDAYTGWITTLVPLDKEKREDYKFQVIATDNGQPKHTTRSTVIIRLKDYNDCPPVFKETHYRATVNEDALPGTVVLQISTTDKDVDLKTAVEYYIISGDSLSQFQIKNTGEVFVVKALDRESIAEYELKVIVTDGKYTSTANISVTVLDANDNPPYCLKYRYREELSEGARPGTPVLQVLANDMDEPANSRLRFYLTGTGVEDFNLDKDSGHLKTARKLDRETQSRYSLMAHVQDRDHPGWECSSQIELALTDLNDNPPEFSMNPYSVTLPEDAEVGTLVTKIHATDADIGINRKIKYAFLDSYRDHFRIAPESGIVTLAKPLDRELKALYNLSVSAIDLGHPPLSNSATLIINVQDINDNPPEFTSKHYFASVPEINSIGSEILKVLATSKDTGINAEISYSIIGGNEHRKFTINNKTGILSLADTLDYERARDYFLTIQAVDGGTPPLSNLATVNISVTDSNDNHPQFTQNSYNARIREDAQRGDRILQVRANDLDAEDNGRVSYTIERGDRMEQFAIEEDTGYISVAGTLDRESISSYVLEVQARDHGVPTLTAYVLVNIEISDANDNPPMFTQSNYTAVVQEDKQIGHTLLKFDVTDADTGQNAAPYTFDFRAGNEGGTFRIEQDGILRTATRFSSKIRDSYQLQVRVFDNGTPPLYSDTWVLVKVIEESQYPPVITPLDIAINSFMDEYPGGVIGKVYATDQDQYDTLTYGLAPTVGVLYSPTNLFNISRNDGVIYAYPRLDVGDYRVNVTVTDGKFSSFTIVKVSVELINEEMLTNAVVIRFIKVSPETFVLSHRKGFIRSVRNAIGCKIKDIIIISVQPSSDDMNLIQHRLSRRSLGGLANVTSTEEENLSSRTRRNTNRDLDVLFTVRKSQTGGYYAAHEIRRSIEENLEEIEDATKLQIDEVVKSKCLPNFCIHGECEDRIVLDPKIIHPVSTDVTSFVSARHSHRMECSCKEGYGGEKCQHAVNECSKSPCPSYKTCIPDSSDQGYHCACREGFAGPKCDRDITLCNDETCYVPRNPVSFGGKSYAHYRIEKEIARKNLEDQLVLSLRLRTVQPTGNIMYSAGKVDFNILEVMNGVIQYRFDLGSGEGMVSVSSIFVSDGLWHEVRLEREGNSAKVFVDGKHVAQGNAPGVNGVLNLQSDDIFFGAEVKQHPTVLGFEDVQKGFIGCMDDIRLSKIPVPLHMNGASTVASLRRFANVEFSCDAVSVLVPLGVCGTQPCWNGGTCKDIGGGNFECLCHSRFSGPFCKEDLDPCSSSPCLYGGKCSKIGFGNYTCDCPARMSGKRCDYGRFCTPNPCRNGGVCEEGDDGPLCMCHGYTGTTCETDIDECERQPCGNGATCINEAGSFSCICPPEMTGTSCGDPLNTNALTIALKKVTPEMFYITASIIGTILMVVVIWGVVCACKKKRRSNRHEKINNEANKGIVLNPVSDTAGGYKRGSKMSNLEIQRDQRPVSYTPSSNNAAEHMYSCNAASMLQYNNLDTLRSYGSAGDELENVPPEYRKGGIVPSTQQMVNINGGGGTANTTSSDTESLHKQKWTDQIQLQTFNHDKLNNDMKRLAQNASPDPSYHHHQHHQHQQQQQQQLQPLLHQQPHPATHHHLRASPMQLKPPQIGILPGRLLNTQHSPTMLMPPHSFEDPPSHHGSTAAYHWDCSDWVGRGHHPLPNITEVPGSEVPDSSSFHSNESNESHPKNSLLPPILGPVDSTRDIETLNEDNESEFVDDSECDQSEQPLSLGFEQNSSISCLNPLDSGSEDYRFNTVPLKVNTPDSYLRHPNSYLPKYNIQSETEGENVPLTGRKPLNGLEIGRHQLVESDDDDVESYGFPQTRRNRREPSDIDLVLKTDEGSSLLSHSRTLNSSNHSNSDLSTQLCEIDDSEYEQDHQPHPQHHHHIQQPAPPSGNVSGGSSSASGSQTGSISTSSGATAKPKQQKVKWSNVVQHTEV
ncbi:fat-like cadherin-related tumor suppressor homolog [Anopheles ziemanni]|uniref:fat-like cadherin-related tumor suppressor homolog n=1 Tax=Anopheles coustani TaxID=139045 RepID=UPI00265B158D|nr:fat-like cadherin-related tumor suppressor homolog [Anopheles coustani]XP_058170139.1 fat-like cadherin-related tumor suppressor homolog [Anopheles ziemanni]